MLHLSPLSFCNLYYLLRKPMGHHPTMALLVKLRQLTRVTMMGEREIAAALASPGKDFEDAVQCESAKSDECIGVIVTRNKGNFPESKLPILTPEEYLVRWDMAR